MIKFVFEEDNKLPAVLYRVNEDNSRTIARPEDVEKVISEALSTYKKHLREEIGKQDRLAFSRMADCVGDEQEADNFPNGYDIACKDILALLKEEVNDE